MPDFDANSRVLTPFCLTTLIMLLPDPEMVTVCDCARSSSATLILASTDPVLVLGWMFKHSCPVNTLRSSAGPREEGGGGSRLMSQ